MGLDGIDQRGAEAGFFASERCVKQDGIGLKLPSVKKDSVELDRFLPAQACSQLLQRPKVASAEW